MTLLMLGDNIMGETFQLFSKIHINILISILLIIILMFVFKGLIYNSKHKKLVRYTLAISLFIVRASEQVLKFVDGTWDIKGDLPLHLCGITSILCIIMLISNNYNLFQVLYFWSLIGSPIALIIPGDLNYSYASPIFWQFIIAHSLNIFSIFYMIFAYKYRPVFKSMQKTFLFSNIYMVFIAIFNYIVGSNYYYFYLCNDPSPSILNPFRFVSSWPLILILLEAATFIAIILFYSPYSIMDNRQIAKTHSVHI